MNDRLKAARWKRFTTQEQFEMENMPPQQTKAYRAWLVGRSYKEISIQLGITTNTVASYLKRAKKWVELSKTL